MRRVDETAVIRGNGCTPPYTPPFSQRGDFFRIPCDKNEIDIRKSETYNLNKIVRLGCPEMTMQTKLTLRLEEHLIEKAKEYAEKAGKSVSQLVAEYFRLLTCEKTGTRSSSTTVTRSLRGLLRECELDEKDYRKYLEEKHR